FAVDDVVEIRPRLVPEAAVERRAHAFRLRLQQTGRGIAVLGAHPALEQADRIVEERVDLDGLAAPRRHDPVAVLGVHPRERVSGLPLPPPVRPTQGSAYPPGPCRSRPSAGSTPMPKRVPRM